MRMHDVSQVSLLRPYLRREEDGVGAPPAFLPDGFVEHEVQEVLSHQDDADNERWYQVKWESQDITWEPEMHMANCRDKISDYFLRIGKPNDRPSRLSKRGRPSKKTRPESQVAIPSDDITLQADKVVKLKQVLDKLPEDLRRSSRLRKALPSFYTKQIE